MTPEPDLLMSPYGIPTVNGEIGYQEPPTAVFPPSASTDGPKAREFLQKVGVNLDPWQCWYFDKLLARREDGFFASKVAGLVVSRQNGKTEMLCARILAGLFLFKEKLILFSCHRRDAALTIFKRMQEIIKASPLLKKRCTIRLTLGDEKIITSDGCEVQFRVRKKGSGRAFSSNCLILDEFMDCERQFIADVMPTMAAKKNSQMIAMGSAGTHESTAFGDLRARALSDNPRSLLFAEWSVELCNEFCSSPCSEHPDPMSVEALRLSNPAYGIRIDHEYLLEEHDTMCQQEGVEYWYRERLSIGTWPTGNATYSVIPKLAWENATKPDLAHNIPPLFVIAVSMSADRTSTILTSVGFTDSVHRDVQVLVLPDSERSGTHWAFERIIELNSKWRSAGLAGFVIDSKGQASTLIEDLVAKGVTVYSPSHLDYASACAEFAVGVVGTKIPDGHKCEDEEVCDIHQAHAPYVFHVNDPLLTTAVAGAGKRKLSNLWAWARSSEQASIVPLEASTLGLWGLQKARKESQLSLPIVTRGMGG